MDQQIEKANTKLEKVRIIKRGSKLSLRATLPPKPGDGSKPKRYIIYPGFSATAEGLKLTVIEAQRIEADLIYGRFSWDTQKDQLIVEKAIAEFEKDYWQRKEKTINRANNYKFDYSNHFLFLPQDQLLTPELLKQAIDTTKPDSRKRRGMAIAYSALLNYFEIKHDLNKYKGNYKPMKKRVIPTEEEIDYYYEHHCKSPQWKWIYGIIACYGIRPSEIWHLDMSLMAQYPPILKVKENTKTGERLVLPLPDEKRVIEWNLQEQIMPKINTEGKSNQELGSRISQKFHHIKIPSPYHFRDAYAIRGLVMGYSSTAMCKWMGNSTSVFEKQYLRHMEEDHFTDAWLRHQYRTKSLKR